MFEKKYRFSVRKLSLGVCSVIIGASFLSTTVMADSLEEAKPTESLSEKGDNAVDTGEPAMPAPVVQPSVREEISKEKTVEVANSLESHQKSTLEVSDVPEGEEQVLRPKEIKFDTWDDLLKWEPDSRSDDAMNRASVPLAPRYQGELVNEKASPEAKVQALSNTNSKAKDHASVGGEEFKSYAFDYWQYLDSMVFWEGLVPTPDVIDAGHRNGVPVYGTLFYNWSNSIADQERFAESLKQDEDGTFPIAKKLVDLAKYYGFDGYFINQETTGDLVKPLGKKMRDFMLYSKEYAEKIKYPIKYSWYDAMTYEYGRYHEDGLGQYNYPFMQKEGNRVPADNLFANFNWNKEKNDYSVSTAKWLGRSPYDVLAGLELQKGGSYHTKVDWQALLDENGKLRLSLGLFAPDTITSLGKTGEDYHKNEDIFFTGYQGDPTGQKPADKDWYGIANLVADRTAAVGKTFSTSFNTGHGRKWFVDGKVAKDSEWNYRSVSGILPTWRWWQSSTAEKLKAGYDFEDAYNGGTSLKFSGDVSQETTQDVKLYSTKIEVTENSKLRVAHKGGQNSKVFLALSTEPKYQFDDPDAWFELTSSDSWKNDVFDLSRLSGKTIYGVKLYFEHEGAAKDYQFNLGQLTISDSDRTPQAPQQLVVSRQVLKNAQEAEAIVQFKASDGADYYEIYQQNGNDWQLLTGSSNTSIYLPKITRSATSQGKEQLLKVVAVGKNGLRSSEALVQFNWGLEVNDTTLPRALAPNIVLGAQVIGSTFAQKDGGESIEGMLNGTITSLSDKWSSDQLSGSVDIRLTQPRHVVRWVMDHAGAGGESVNDGLMNTKDFDLYYKDAAGEWQLAKAVRGNKAHVSDIILDKPITAQDWRLQVITSDNGTPWRAIRIYNWKMYEALDTESENIPMAHVAARSLGNQTVQLGFKDVPKDAQVMIYDSAQAKQPLTTLKASQAGDLASSALHFENLPSILYYRTQLPGKELSNILAVHIPQEEKRISKISLETSPVKKVYRQGDTLSLKGGKFRVRFEGSEPDELINLSNPAVTVSGFDSSQLGEQKLSVTYLGLAVDGELAVYLASPAEAGEKSIAGLHITQLPKVQYTVGDQLDLSEGRFEVLFDDESSESHRLIEGEILGYDNQKAGRQKLTLKYQGHETSFDVLVSPKAALNDEYLKQALAKAEAGQSEKAYRFASQDKQKQVQEQIAHAKELLADYSSSQETVNQALQDLNQALARLDGQVNYGDAVQRLEKVKVAAEESLNMVSNHELSDLLNQIPLLLENKTATLKDFSDLEKAIQDKLTAKVEQHVGSLEKGEERGPAVEELPRLLVEEVELAFKQEERVNPELPVSVKRLVQKGMPGLEHQFIEVDSSGHRKLIGLERVRPAQAEIIEVGGKENYQITPDEGVKNLIATKPKLQVEEITIPFARQKRTNPTLALGEEQVVQTGQTGVERQFVEVDENGSHKIVHVKLVANPIDEIVEVGSKLKDTVIQMQVSSPSQTIPASSKPAQKSHQLPNTGEEQRNDLALQGLLTLGLLSAGLTLKKRKR